MIELTTARMLELQMHNANLDWSKNRKPSALPMLPTHWIYQYDRPELNAQSQLVKKVDNDIKVFYKATKRDRVAEKFQKHKISTNSHITSRRDKTYQ